MPSKFCVEPHAPLTCTEKPQGRWTGRLKKTVIILGLTTLPAYAQFVGPAETPSGLTTTKQLQESGYDNQRVVMRGRLAYRINHKFFRFADEAGQMLVKIHPNRWPAGLSVNENTLVEISGKYDKDWMATPKVQVFWITLVQ